MAVRSWQRTSRTIRADWSSPTRALIIHQCRLHYTLLRDKRIRQEAELVSLVTFEFLLYNFTFYYLLTPVLQELVNLNSQSKIFSICVFLALISHICLKRSLSGHIFFWDASNIFSLFFIKVLTKSESQRPPYNNEHGFLICQWNSTCSLMAGFIYFQPCI